MRKTVWVILLMVIILSACNAKKREQSDPSDTSRIEEPTTASVTEPVSEAQEMANKISVGMTYAEVVEILGPADGPIGSGMPVDQYLINDEEALKITYMEDYSVPDHPARVISIIIGKPEEMALTPESSLPATATTCP